MTPDIFERLLQAHLHRQGCLDPDTLCDYALDVLDEVKRHEANAHLATCAACTREVTWVQAVFQADEVEQHSQNTRNQRLTQTIPASATSDEHPSPSLGERIKRFVGQLLPSQPQLALRGASDVRSWYAPFEGGQLFVEMASAKGATATHLTGQVLMDDLGEAWVGAQVQVRQGNPVLATTVLDDLGEFECDVALADDGLLTIEVTALGGDQIVVQSKHA